MSNLEIKTIKRKITIPRIRLWVIWFLLVVFPTIAGLLIYLTYNKEYSYFTNTELISKGYESIESYNNIIAPENYMTNQILELQTLESNVSPEILKAKIDEVLCGETMFCMFFDENAEKITTVKSPKASNENFRIPPLPLIKPHLKNLISSYKTFPNDNLEKHQHSFGPVLQQLFKTATTINISKDKISKNFSLKYGGELYFGFVLFKKNYNNNHGFFFVMRGRDFYFKTMLNKLHKKYPEIKIIFKEMDIQQSYRNPEKFHSGLQKINGEHVIIAPASMSFSRHVIHHGTENYDKRFNKLLPFIEYTIPTEEIKNQQTKTFNNLRLIALLIIIISGIYCLHIHMFGFDERLNFKHKILLLSFITSIFPFSLFSISVYTVNRYNRFINELSIKQHAAIELQISNLQLEQYMIKIESDLAETVEHLTTLLNTKPVLKSTIEDYLVQACKKIPVTSVMVFFKKMPEGLSGLVDDDKLLMQFSERISTENVDEATDATFMKIPEFALDTINDNDEIIPDRERRDCFTLCGKEISATAINEFLINDGKLNVLTNGNVPVWFSALQIDDLSVKTNKEVMGLLVAKFEPKPLIVAYIENSFISKKYFKEYVGNYEINYSFLPIPSSGSAKYWFGTGNIKDEDKELCLSKPTSESIDASKDSTYKIIIKNMNQLVPHLAVAIITERTNHNENLIIVYTVLAVVVFLALILFLTSKLFDLMFAEPVNALASSAIAIAKGSENWEAEIKSGDEFEALNKDFKHLVTSLKERNLLKSYLSEDAFSDIEENNSLNLLPGGEYKEATILFSAIKDYDKLTAQMSPDDVIKLLSQYISIAEEITKAYGGSLDKILGDTIMLVFREDPAQESHGLRAAKAALSFVEKIKEAGFPGLYTGIASGTVISGKIGSYSGKLDFTVIGNPVNLAARFKTESKNGSESTGIIISGITMKLMNGRGRVKFLRRVSIKGKARKYNIYELEGLRD